MQKHPFLEPINYIRPLLETPVFRLCKHLYSVSPLSLALSFHCSRFQLYSPLSDIARLSAGFSLSTGSPKSSKVSYFIPSTFLFRFPRLCLHFN